MTRDNTHYLWYDTQYKGRTRDIAKGLKGLTYTCEPYQSQRCKPRRTTMNIPCTSNVPHPFMLWCLLISMHRMFLTGTFPFSTDPAVLPRPHHVLYFLKKRYEKLLLLRSKCRMISSRPRLRRGRSSSPRYARLTVLPSSELSVMTYFPTTRMRRNDKNKNKKPAVPIDTSMGRT